MAEWNVHDSDGDVKLDIVLFVVPLSHLVHHPCFYFSVVHNIQRFNDENIHEEQKNQQRSNAPAKVDGFGLASHSEGGESAEHVEVGEKFPNHHPLPIDKIKNRLNIYRHNSLKTC